MEITNCQSGVGRWLLTKILRTSIRTVLEGFIKKIKKKHSNDPSHFTPKITVVEITLSWYHWVEVTQVLLWSVFRKDNPKYFMKETIFTARVKASVWPLY